MKSSTLKTAWQVLFTLASAGWLQAGVIETQVNQPIPDGDLSGLASTINLSGLTTPIGNLEVDLNISGTFNGDLYAYLTHGSGFVVLLNRAGTTANNDLGYGDHGLNVIFANNAPDVHTYQTTLAGSGGLPWNGPLTGTWGPDGRAVSPLNVTDADPRTASLSSFQGLDPNGQWTLFVADVNGGDVHELNSWSLNLDASTIAVPESGNTFSMLLIAMGLALGIWLKTGRRLTSIRSDTAGQCHLGLKAIHRSGRFEGWAGLAGAMLGGSIVIHAQPAWFNGFPLHPPQPLPTVSRGVLTADGTVYPACCGMESWNDIVAVVYTGYGHYLGLQGDGSFVFTGDRTGLDQFPQWTDLVQAVGFISTTCRGCDRVYLTGLRSDGTVVALEGTPEWAARPDAVENTWKDIVALPTGGGQSYGYVSAGLKSDGTVVSTITATESWNGITALAEGSSHLVGLKADGTVLAVGIYDGSPNCVGCEVTGWTGITAIAAGYNCTVGLKADGTVVAVGDNYYGQCNVQNWEHIVAIAAGTVGLKADGTVLSTDGHTSTWYLGKAGVAPIFTVQPENSVSILNGPAHLRAAAAGPGTISYQWYRNGVALKDDLRTAGSTSVELSIDSTQPADEGDYTVVVSNEYGATTGSPATLRVFPMPRHQIPNVAAGYDSTVGLRIDGTVVIAGAQYGSLRSDVGKPVWSNIVAVSEVPWTGNGQLLGLRPDGTVLIAGQNYSPLNTTDWTGMIGMASSGSHALGLRADGTVLALGDNNYGQCKVGTWSNIAAVAVGTVHSIGLRTDGTVVAVGSNDAGQCEVGNWRNIVAIGAGWAHTVGVRADGSVVAVGWNDAGQCDVANWRNIVAIGVGGSHTVGVRADGSVVAVGFNLYGQCDVSGWSGIKAVAASNHHTVGVKGDGSVVAVGSNYYGQLDTEAWYLGVLGAPPGITQPPVDEAAILGGVGRFHVTALGDGPVTYQWYHDGKALADGGQFNGTASPSLTVMPINRAEEGDYQVVVADSYGTTSSPVVQLRSFAMPPHHLPNVAMGTAHIVGLNRNGTVVAAGYNAGGQCNVSDWSGIEAISAGSYHTLGLKPDGTVLVTGENVFGETFVADWTGIVSLAGGAFTTLGLRGDGTVLAVGANGNHQLDVGGWSHIVALAAGDAHTVGLRTDGTVVAVGDNEYGQCDVSDWSGIVAIAAGFSQTAGLRADGTVVRVGRSLVSPPSVDDWNHIIAIAQGDNHTVGLRADGTVVATGDNTDGQCDVGQWSGVVAIAAGGDDSVGLKADGTVLTAGLVHWGPSDVVNWSLGSSVNQPPVAGTYQLTTGRNRPQTTPVFALQQVCHDPENDTLVITDVRPNSAAGGTAQIRSNTVFYAPPADFVGSDTFAYTVWDSRGGSAQGTVEVTVVESTALSLFNTGADTASKSLSDGTIGDPHYALLSVPDGTTQIRVRTSLGGWPIPPYLGDDSLSAWIGPNNDSAVDGPAGRYVYRTTFDLCGFDPATASIDGQWSSDDEGMDILLNGVSIGNGANPNYGPFEFWTPFVIETGFVAGMNTLDFVVNNGGGPTALRVEMVGTAARALVARNVNLGTSRNQAASLSLGKLQQGCGQLAGQSLTVSGVSSPSAAGGAVELRGSSIIYTPPQSFVGADSFTYTIRDADGLSAQGTINVMVTAPVSSGPNVVGVTVSPGGLATVQFAGIPGLSYVVQASSDLITWSDIGSAAAGTNGLFEFVDTQSGDFTARYYRTRYTSSGP